MFALIDCNNFFASCEKVFDLSLKNKPLIILSNNDGCVIARSNEAKKLGIKMAQPAFEIKDLIDSQVVHVRSSNFSLYTDMSRRVMQTLVEFENDMEFYSVDEVFMRIPSESKPNLEKLADQIQKKVKKWTGLSVSVGIGSTKTLAKLANKLAKEGPNIKVLCHEYEIDSILDKTDLSDIWGIGKRCAKRLKKASIHSPLELKQTDDIIIKKILGVMGLRISLELRGVSSFSLDNSPSSRKSISFSRSFGKPTSKLLDLEEAVSTFTAKAAEKLRKEKKMTSFISVFISSGKKPKGQYYNQAGVTIPIPLSYTPDLIFYAKRCLRKIYKPGILYKKTSVMLTDFSNQASTQKDLFEKEDNLIKKEKLMQLIDKINNHYDKESLFFMASGINKSWKSIRTNTSPKYTTSWNDLLKVK